MMADQQEYYVVEMLITDERERTGPTICYRELAAAQQELARRVANFPSVRFQLKTLTEQQKGNGRDQTETVVG